MRGPVDDAIEAGADDGGRKAAAAAGEGERERSPGGKPLLRLIDLLAPKGLDGALEFAVTSAVAGNGFGPAIQAQLTAMGARPEGGGRAEETPSPQEVAGGVDYPRGEVDSPGEAPTAVSEEIVEAYRAAADKMGPPTATGPQWRSLGPWTIPNGQTYGSNRVNVSGRIAAIAIDPGNAAHVLCGAAGGGVWESFDRGGSWAPRTDYAATCTVGAIAFDPARPATVYCGTGEGNFYSWLGQGILRSTDGGTTWATLCTAPFVGQGFYELVVDPTTPTRLLAGTNFGLYVSTDSGVTWTQRRRQACWSISAGVGRGNQVEWLAACADGLFRSTDAGTTWTAVTLPSAPASWNRLAVGIARSNPAVAYAWGASGGAGRLYRRAGGTWTAVAAPPGVNVAQAWYDWFLAVSPDRDTQIYCGAIEVHRGDLAGTTWTWTNITAKPGPGQSIHPDQHALAFEPGNPSTIYIGNDGGLYRSPDRGITFQHCNNGLVISEFEYLAHHPGSARWLIGGTQDNGTERWTGSQVWEHVADGDGGDCGVNHTDPRTVFHTYFNMSPDRSTSSGDFGTWTFIPPPVPAGEGSRFYPPFEVSATTGDTIAMAGGALYVSRNNGAAWTRLAYPSAGQGSAMAMPNGDAVYVGLEDGRVLRTTWNGSSWTALAALGTPRSGAAVSDLLVDPSNPSRIWATYSRVGGGRVYRSDDAGANWIDRSTAGLPGLPINAVQVDPWNGNRVWVAADLGVYESTDAGGSWHDFSNALPSAYVGDILFQPHARVLRAGTRNRGVWEIPVDGWITRPQCGVQFTGQLAGNASGRWFTFNWPAAWHMVWTVMPTTPGAQLQLTVQVERATSEFCTYWLTVRNLTAQACSFEGRWCLLSRY